MAHVAPLRVAALAAVAMCAFAANSVLCRLALSQSAIDPGTFTIVRIVSGAVMLSLICLGRGNFRLAGSWQGGAALLAYAACFSFAYVSLTAATGALLLFGSVQTTMLLKGLMSGERFSGRQWVGFGMAVAGLLVLLLPGVAAPAPGSAMLMILAGVAWGFYSLIGRGNKDPLGATAGNFLRAVPLALPLALLAAPVWDTAGLVWAVLSGAIASGVGYAIWYTALPGLTATRAATVQLSVPVITALGGAVALGEPLFLRLIVASCAVLGGIALVVTQTKAASPAPSQNTGRRS